MSRQLRDNSLALVFGALLLIVLAAQALVGLAGYNQAARTDGLAQIDLWRYLTSSSFAVDVAENWQSEYLQFTLYILLTVWLVQRGSSESKPPERAGLGEDSDEQIGDFAQDGAPALVRRGGWWTTLYSWSLTAVMAVVFLASWLAQAFTGRVAYNEERMRDLLDPLTLGEYIGSPDFWGRTFQNWQSELLAVGSMAIFAVYLRQRGSPESKKVGAAHHATPDR